jgi:hypothetical protein
VPLRFYLNIHGTCVILGRLSMSGKIDSSDSYGHDPILGDDFTLSGSLALASAEREADGTGVAVFVADSPVDLQIGNHLIGSVLIATYVESGSSSQFSVTLTNLRAGPVSSGYVQDLLAGPTPPAYGIVLASSTPLFDQIQSGNLPQTPLSGTALGVIRDPDTVPALSTMGAAIVAALMLAGGLLLLRARRRSPGGDEMRS